MVFEERVNHNLLALKTGEDVREETIGDDEGNEEE